jgi:hypothetical protein
MPPKKEVREIKCQFCGLEFGVKTGNKCLDCGTILERVSDARGLRVFSFAIAIAITLLLILFLILNIMNLVSFDKLQKP